MSHLSPKGMVRTGAITGWKELTPPLLAPKKPAPPERMGTFSWAQMNEDPAMNSARSRNTLQVARNGSTKYRHGGPTLSNRLEQLKLQLGHDLKVVRGVSSVVIEASRECYFSGHHVFVLIRTPSNDSSHQQKDCKYVTRF